LITSLQAVVEDQATNGIGLIDNDSLQIRGKSTLSVSIRASGQQETIAKEKPKRLIVDH
jgi:hypothetical protein